MDSAVAFDDYDPEGGHQEPLSSQHNGCRQLLVALLEDLFHCKHARQTSRSAFSQWQKDCRWITSKRNTPFSFVWVCQELGLDPDRVRAAYFIEPSEERSNQERERPAQPVFLSLWVREVSYSAAPPSGSP